VNYYNYFTEIEETFVRRRGKHLFLSPLDWALIEAWQGRGVPLHIVIRSIESVFDVFDKQPAGTRTIKSLFYCREEIETQHAEWLRSRIGTSDEGQGTRDKSKAESGFSAVAVAAHIAGSIAALRENQTTGVREDLDRAVGRLEELAAVETNNFETIDQTLGDVERLLERAMLANWNADQLKAIKKEVAGQLRAYKAEMDADSYKNTFDLMLMKRLREDAGIPRLGLFYL
jgi:hypothetical protein